MQLEWYFCHTLTCSNILRHSRYTFSLSEMLPKIHLNIAFLSMSFLPGSFFWKKKKDFQNILKIPYYQPIFFFFLIYFHNNYISHICVYRYMKSIPLYITSLASNICVFFGEIILYWTKIYAVNIKQITHSFITFYLKAK